MEEIRVTHPTLAMAERNAGSGSQKSFSRRECCHNEKRMRQAARSRWHHSRKSYKEALLSPVRPRTINPLHLEHSKGATTKAILADIVQPANLGRSPQQTIASALADRFGRYPTNFVVARHREHDYMVFLPN
uniref:Uncharacterized protein n=1 Tax=Ananas comosus var. bracteatus TaxID=296719 RepID=A0A6V7PEP4_ANACO|nr:unnamed protein product [Ananas comosus var. bracteatus]